MVWRDNPFAYTKIDDELRMNGRQIQLTLRIPDQLTHEKTVILSPGILAARHLYNPLAKSLAQRGIASATFGYESAGPWCAGQVRSVVEEIEGRRQAPSVLSGHSLGGIHAIEAARDAAPGSELIVMASAGFGGVHPERALETVFGDRPDNSHVRHELKVVRDGLGYAIKSLHSMSYLARTAQSRIGVELSRDVPDWMPKHALLFAGDRLIDPIEATEGLAEARFAVSTLAVRRAGHNAPMYHPHEVADAIVGMICDEAALPAETKLAS